MNDMLFFFCFIASILAGVHPHAWDNKVMMSIRVLLCIIAGYYSQNAKPVLGDTEPPISPWHWAFECAHLSCMYAYMFFCFSLTLITGLSDDFCFYMYAPMCR